MLMVCIQGRKCTCAHGLYTGRKVNAQMYKPRRMDPRPPPSCRRLVVGEQQASLSIEMAEALVVAQISRSSASSSTRTPQHRNGRGAGGGSDFALVCLLFDAHGNRLDLLQSRRRPHVF